MAEAADKGPLELGAEMDYAEHERTYDAFLKLTKYGTIACVALMIAMAFGFFVGGWFSGLLVFLIVLVGGIVAL